MSRARRSTKSTIAGSSITGLVSGWQTMVVTPPAAAAWLAVASVSRCSAPGSPTKARMSTRPGATTLAARSRRPRCPPARRPRRCRAWPRGSRRRRSAGRRGMSRSREGSTMRALASRIGRRSRAMRSMTSGSRIGQVRDSASSTAMRTATPISTCSRISDCAPSATAESISTPRFIGPGCITSASGLA